MARRSRSEEFKRRGHVVDLEAVKEARESRKVGSKKTVRKQTVSEEKRSKASKKAFDKRRFMMQLIVVGIIIIVMGGITIQLVEELIEKNRLEKENIALREELQSVYNELKSLDDPEYMEELAREKLDMVNPGEIVFQLPEEE